MKIIRITAIFLTVFFSLGNSLFANEKVELKWVLKNKVGKKKTAKNSEKDEDAYSRNYYSNRTTVDSSNWFFKLSTTVTYINLGSEIKSELDRVESVFNGSKLKLSMLHLNPEMTIKTTDKVERAVTQFLPTGNIGLGFLFGNHLMEFNMGTAGMVPLKTIDIDTTAVITETSGNDLETLGFVDGTGTGNYDIQLVMNEKVWILTPEFTYGYTFLETSFGDFSAGGTLGAVIASLRQEVSLRMKKKGGASRIIESDILSTAFNDVGPMARIFVGFKTSLFLDLDLDIKIGANYGFVDLHRNVDGTGTVNMDGSMYATFPVTAMAVDGKPFNSVETNRLEMAGFFIQAGILF